MTLDQRFRPRERLRKRDEFARVYAARRTDSDQTLVIFVADNGLDWSRLGLSVGRRVGNAAVRNRIRRRIRESFRRNKSLLPTGLDVICAPRPGKIPTYADLENSLRLLVIRASRRRTQPQACKPEPKLPTEDTS